MSRKPIDMTNKRFGRWMVLSQAGYLNARAAWLCRCDCGIERVVDGADLRKGDSKSCGCLSRELSAERARLIDKTTHGMSHLPEYAVWQGMKNRCTDPTNKSWAYYGGRGIQVRLSFEDFYAEVGQRPEGMTIDRINNDGHYEAGNLRWATRSEQEKNKWHAPVNR